MPLMLRPFFVGEKKGAMFFITLGRVEGGLSRKGGHKKSHCGLQLSPEDLESLVNEQILLLEIRDPWY